MATEQPSRPAEAPVTVEQTRAFWERKAAFWDQAMERGTRLHRELLPPIVERLLAVAAGDTVLDIACGNGQWSRRLARAGVAVVACDFSAGLIERARARTLPEEAGRIEYRVLDATAAEQLRALGQDRFDAALCNMALMDMPALDPLMTALARLLKPGGRFVFTVLHPCFNMPGSTILAERGDRQGRLVTTHALKLTRYARIPPEPGLGIVGEPVPHYYFHRPLSELLGAGFRAGLMLDAFEEPVFEAAEPVADPLGWENLDQFPYVLIGRLRRLGG